MDFVTISIAVFFLVLAYVVFQKYLDDEPEMLDGKSATTIVANQGVRSPPGVTAAPLNSESVPDEKVSEVVYTQDYFPWFRSTRWWNYDGWLYQKP